MKGHAEMDEDTDLVRRFIDGSGYPLDSESALGALARIKAFVALLQIRNDRLLKDGAVEALPALKRAAERIEQLTAALAEAEAEIARLRLGSLRITAYTTVVDEGAG